MRIVKGEMIAGYPALVIRNLLRSADVLDESDIINILGLEPRPARRLLQDLTVLGLIGPGKEKGTFAVAERGISLRLASAAAPVTRRTADRLLAGFVTRIPKVNANDELAYRVDKAVVFGEYVSHNGPVTAVNVAVELQRRLSAGEEQWQLEQARIRLADRSFKNIVDQLFYPQTEVLRLLLARSRGLHFYDLRHNTEAIYEEPHRFLFGEKEGQEK